MNTATIKGFQISYFNSDEFTNIRNEIFNEGIYNIEFDTQNPFIIDAGAHIGMSTIFFKSISPNSEILAIEPNPRSYEVLQRNIEQNNLKKVETVNKALDSKERVQVLYIDPTEDRWDSSASFNQGGWKGGYNTQQIRVETLTLSSIIKDRVVDLLKLDIEGAEQRVIVEAQQYLKNIRNIIIEFHPTANQNLEKVLKILRKNNFEVSVEGEELKIIKARAK